MKNNVGKLAFCLIVLLGFGGCEIFSKKSSAPTTEPPKTTAEPEGASSPTASAQSQALNTTPPSTTRKQSCICKCIADIDNKPTPICAHFSRVNTSKGDPQFECDAVFQVLSELENCKVTQKSPDFAPCTGFHPESKAGGLKGQLKDCHPG